jgi:hypothetical protein
MKTKTEERNMKTMSPAYKLNKGFIVQKMGKETVIFDPDRSVLYTLNETASFVFSRLKKGLDQTAIVSALTKTFAVTPEHALKDVVTLLRDFKKKRILKS